MDIPRAVMDVIAWGSGPRTRIFGTAMFDSVGEASSWSSKMVVGVSGGIIWDFTLWKVPDSDEDGREEGAWLFCW